jgi:hypothetical protein
MWLGADKTAEPAVQGSRSVQSVEGPANKPHELSYNPTGVGRIAIYLQALVFDANVKAA